MEADPQPPPVSPEFTTRQLELISALAKMKVGDRYPLVAMFKGGLIAMKQNEDENPEVFVHAAQSLRELLDMFERSMSLSDHEKDEDIGITEPIRRKYADKWLTTKLESACFNHKACSWAGTIDSSLVEFLGDTEAFIGRYEAHSIYLKNRKTMVMVTLDPMFENLSEDEQERIALEWRRLKKFFNGVAHHSGTKRSEMEKAVEQLEIFLHRRLIPVEVANKNAILAFIEGIEAS
jgi:hypothetical protein